MNLVQRARGVLATLVLFVHAGAHATPQPLGLPLECPQCGTWSLTHTVPPGAVGEQVQIDRDRVVIPMCGDFRPMAESSIITQTSEISSRTYWVTLELRGTGGSACPENIDDIDALRLLVEVRNSFTKEGGTANFKLVDSRSGITLYEAVGWNYERDSPCDSGGSSGSNACLSVAFAGLQRQLFQSALLADPNYRVGRVLRAAERACKGKGEGAGASWPWYWERNCQWELVKAKLQEFTAHHACRSEERQREISALLSRKKTGQADGKSKRSTCRLPDENVARPSDDLP